MRLGAHMSVAGGVHTAFSRAASVGCTALQIFVKNANRWNAKPLPEEDARRFAAERRRTRIRSVVAHDSYLINLASPDATLWKRSISALVDEIERCEALGVTGLVAHPGAHVGSGERKGIARIARGLDAAFRRTPGFKCRVLLETTAGSGTNLGCRFEHLARIRERTRLPERVGTCLDTCHVFAAGYDLRSAAACRETLDRFDVTCGLRTLGAIHLNDSLKPLGSRRDRHAHIGAGEIGLAGFGAIVRDRRLARVPMILETPKGDDLREDAYNLATLRALAAGRRKPSTRPPRTAAWRSGVLPPRRAGRRRGAS